MSKAIVEVDKLSTEELTSLMKAVNSEYHVRMIERDDFYRIIEDSSRSTDLSPYVSDEYLLCFGEKIITGKSSHRCSFTQINGKWVWESDYLVKEWIEYINNSGSLESLSLVTPIENLSISKINSVFKNDSHKLVSIENFTITDGEVVRVRNYKNNNNLNMSHGL